MTKAVHSKRSAALLKPCAQASGPTMRKNS
jgi:hypothetical protein